jgi:hypothetical protein
MLRFCLLILFFIPILVCAQSKPKPSPPPPPPKGIGGTGNGSGSNDAGNSGAGSGTGGTGIQFLTIPITGQYKLGMLRKEYDSLKKKEIPTINVSGQRYPMSLHSQFIGYRLYRLELKLIKTDDPDAHEAIIKSFVGRFGDPDSKLKEDRKETFPNESDSTISGEHQVKETTVKWKLRKYEVSIYSKIIEISKGNWKNEFSLRYTGDRDYMTILRMQEAREGY